MKLKSAKIKNFRLLKNLTLNFSTDDARPLTVIRAANESGKTTCEYALMWGLWGEQGLPNKYKEFQILPADIANDKNVIPEVTIEFEAESDRGVKKAYRLNRQLIRNGSVFRDTLDIYELKLAGNERLLDSQAIKLVNNIIPSSLKDIYFTDGDRALSFIEANTSATVKKKRVEEAIRSLLSLDILETTIRHVNSASISFSKEIDNTDYASELKKTNDKILFNKGEIEEAEEELSDLLTRKENLVQSKLDIRKKIDEILSHGDKEALKKQRNTIEIELEKLRKNEAVALENQRKLVQNTDVGFALIADKFKKAKQYLASLESKKQLPKANIPILEELLDKDLCFCGSSLDEHNDEGAKRRGFILHAIKESEESDKVTQIATSLYYSVRSLDMNMAKQRWENAYQDACGQYLSLSNLVTSKEYELEKKIKEIDAINDDGLQAFRAQEKKLEDDIHDKSNNIGRLQKTIDAAKEKLLELENKRKTIEKRLNKEDKTTNKIYLANDLKEGFQTILEKLKNDEVERVSNEMNRIFLEMVGSSGDSNEFSSITHAELTTDHEIKVYGLDHKLINADQDLNGASRRAITLAFILALTKVAQVEAPNVIDTPLGMMSGYVKQSVLRQIIKEGSQSILFLTHDEINGVQVLIDKYAGEVFTLTNPAHYPIMLKNKPPVEDARIIRCECNHNASCAICERIELSEV